ncbi:hypothetical protein D3C71_1871730 [compost metagenome]
MVTTAARISSKVLDSDAWNASAAPWKRVCTPSGMPICCCTCSITLTASPSEAPWARLNDMVTAGNWPMWEIASCAWRCSIRASADSRTWPPSVALTWIDSSACGPMLAAVCDCNTTRYWLAWV